MQILPWYKTIVGIYSFFHSFETKGFQFVLTKSFWSAIPSISTDVNITEFQRTILLLLF